jgi:YD repeat-containing protein
MRFNRRKLRIQPALRSLTRFALAALLTTSVACVDDPDALDPANNESALLVWLIGLGAVQVNVPECGYATPAYRVNNASDASTLFSLKHARDNTTFNFAMFQLSGCTPLTLTNSGLPATFELRYYPNRLIESRVEVGPGSTLSGALNAEGLVTRVRNDSPCMAGEAIVQERTYDALNRVVRQYSPPAANCGGWGGEESLIEYAGFSRLPARSIFYDGATLFTDSLSAYTFSNGLVVGVENTCLGGSSCSVQSLRYTYNSLGQMIQEEEVFPSPSVATYTYDAAGRILTASAGANTTAYTYDALGRVSLVTESMPPLTLSFTY